MDSGGLGAGATKMFRDFPLLHPLPFTPEAPHRSPGRLNCTVRLPGNGDRDVCAEPLIAPSAYREAGFSGADSGGLGACANKEFRDFPLLT